VTALGTDPIQTMVGYYFYYVAYVGRHRYQVLDGDARARSSFRTPNRKFLVQQDHSQKGATPSH
jgi:hypothetical protein